MTELHPFYEAHRPQMEEAMRQRLDFADPLLREHLRPERHHRSRARRSWTNSTPCFNRCRMSAVRESRMTRLLHAAPRLHGDRTRAAPTWAAREGDRRHRGGNLQGAIADGARGGAPESGASVHVGENKALVREQAALSHEQKYPGDFVYDFVEPGPNDRFEFGINYRACGFCKFAAAARRQGHSAEHLRARFRGLRDARHQARAHANAGGRRHALQFPLYVHVVHDVRT